MIALLILFTLCLIVGVCAYRYGYDSCARSYSKEAELAGYGMSWTDRTDGRLAQELADELRLARERRLAGRRPGEAQVELEQRSTGNPGPHARVLPAVS